MWIENKNKDRVINLESGIAIYIDGNMILMEKNNVKEELGTYSDFVEAENKFKQFKSSLFNRHEYFRF